MEVVHPGLRWKVVAAMLTTVLRSDRMDLHQNAKTTPNGRLLMVQRLVEGWSVARVAAAFGVTTRTVRKWQARHAREGLAGLRDRSSRPHVSPTRLDEAAEADDPGATPRAPVRPGDRAAARPAGRHRRPGPAPPWPGPA